MGTRAMRPGNTVAVRLPDGAQVFPVHVQAIGATVDLGGAQLNEVHQRLLQPAAMQVLFQAEHGLVCLRRGSEHAEACFHGSPKQIDVNASTASPRRDGPNRAVKAGILARNPATFPSILC